MEVGISLEADARQIRDGDVTVLDPHPAGRMGQEIDFVTSRTSTVRTDMAFGFPLFVMAGLVPAIHVFLAAPPSRRGCPR
jgi:hypothetical protein